MLKKLLALILVMMLAIPLGAQASEQGYITNMSTTESSTTFTFGNVGQRLQSIDVYLDGQLIQSYTGLYVISKNITINNLSPVTQYNLDIVAVGTLDGQYSDNDVITTGGTMADETDDTPPPATVYEDYTGGNAGDEPNNHVASADSVSKLTSGWQFKNSWDYYSWNGSGASVQGIANSAGGSFRVDVPAHSIKQMLDGIPLSNQALVVELWEDDGAFGDDFVKQWVVLPKSYTQHLDISDAYEWTDGLNRKAEFYIKVISNYAVNGNYLTFRLYD